MPAIESVEERTKKREKTREEHKANRRGGSSDTQGNGNNPEENNNPQNGQQGTPENNNQGDPNNQPNTQNNGQTPLRTPDFDGQSHAYDMNMPHGTKQQEGTKKNQKGGGGGDHKPYKPEGFNFEYDKKLIMEVLDEMFQKYFLALPLDKITDFTIIAVDWFLFAPFTGGASSSDVKERKKKTVLDYRDDLRDEYINKGKMGLKVFFQGHKELKDNVEKAKNGLPTTWKEFGREPACFRGLLDAARQAEADPNSEAAKRWKMFEKLPEKMMKAFQKEDVLRYCGLTLAAAELEVNPEGVEMPRKVSAKFDKMSKVIEKSNDIVELKDKMAEQISEIRPLIVEGTPINVAISEKLNEIAHIIGSPSNDLDRVKKDLGKKVKELKTVDAFPKAIEAKSKPYYECISGNIDKILEVYHDEPEKALEEITKYMGDLKETIAVDLEKETQKCVEDHTINAKKIRRNKVQKRIENAKKAIDQFDLGGMPISQRQEAVEKHPYPLSGNRLNILNSLTRYTESR